MPSSRGEEEVLISRMGKGELEEEKKGPSHEEI